MNIWLPIIVNLLIAGVLLVGAIRGRKNGFVYTITKLVTLCGLGVGIYFLAPVVTNLILKISFINELIIQNIITKPIINSLVILILFGLVSLIVTIIFRLIKSTGNKTFILNKAKSVKVKGINRQETRRLRKEERKLQKEQRKQILELRQSKISKKSRVFGCITGVVLGIIVAFVITLPLKPIFNQIALNQSNISEITKGYEYTPYGQLDKVTDIVNRVIGE